LDSLLQKFGGTAAAHSSVGILPADFRGNPAAFEKVTYRRAAFVCTTARPRDGASIQLRCTWYAAAAT